MTSFADRSIHWLARLLAARPRGASALSPGTPTALDGLTAVAAAEASWRQTAGLGAGFPSSVACRAWASMASAGRRNVFGEPIGSMEAAGSRGALAAAIGAACAGRRAVAFAAGADLEGCGDLLRLAAERHAPMVLHVAARAGDGRATRFGGGHDGVMSALDAGWGVLFASSVQSAVDLSLVAACASERSLTPFVVAMDAVETGLGAQDVTLPDAAPASELLREPGRWTAPETPAQRATLGERRRRAIRWHDADHPAMSGPALEGGRANAGAASDAVFFGAPVAGILDDAMGEVGGRTGRPMSPLEAHGVRGAQTLVVCVGDASERVRAVADALRGRVGVAEVRSLRPWPDGALAEAARGVRRVVVLERSSAPLSADGPLTREVRGSLGRAGVSVPIHTAVHGVGGPAASPGDLAALLRRAGEGLPPRVFVGVACLPEDGLSPRRRATIDAIRRETPDANDACVRAAPGDGPALDERVLRVAIARTEDAAGTALAGEAARLLHAVAGGRLRSAPGLAPRGLVVDRFEVGAGALTPGEDSAADVVVVEPWRLPAGSGATRLARDGGVVIVPTVEGREGPIGLERADLEDAAARGISLALAPAAPARADERPEPAWRRHEALLGALCARGASGVTPKKAADARSGLLERDGARGAEDRLGAFGRGFAGAREVEPGDLEPFVPEPTREGPPDHLRGMVGSGRPLTDLPEFWSRVESAADAADPFAAVPTVPALSSSLRSVADPSGLMVEFEPETCDGVGAAWTSCPDGSIAAAALGPAAILETGIRLAAERGEAGDALRPVLGKLATRINRLALEASRPPVTVREASEDAFAWLVEKMAPAEDRRAALEGAFAAVMSAIGTLPIARTVALFDEAEAESSGSGSFLILAPNPDACVDARSAAGPCEGRGLRIVERTGARLERARGLWRMFERLPDTPGETVERASRSAVVGRLGAIMLARGCAQALAPGDAGEPGGGARQALRIVVAACEAEAQPRVQRLLGEIRTLRERLGASIRETLAASLPDADLDALSEGLRSLGREDVELSALSERIAGAAEGPRVDAVRLGRLVEAARGLADLEWRLAEGSSGLGRARFGVALGAGSGTLWAMVDPLNPLAGPVTVAGAGEAADLARGLCEGPMELAVEAARIVRWARAELDRPAEAAREPARLRSLAWGDLDEEERSVCPVMLLVGDDESLAAGSIGPLLGLLSSGLPVRVAVLSGAGGRADTALSVDALGRYPAGAVDDVALLATLGRSAFVARCSIAAGDHLAETMARAVRFAGPALVHVHAPSPRRHGFEAHRTLAQAELAIRSRAHFLFRFDPRAGGVFGSCLDLSGNPDPLETFSGTDDGRPLTPLHWAATERRFAPWFRAPAPGEATAPAERLLATPPAERDGRVARVVDPRDGAERVASDEMVALADERVRLWRTLQELAGVVTPFTQRVREDAERSVAGDRTREIEALRREHAAALAALRDGFELEAVGRVREGLMRLAGYGPDADEADGSGAG